MILSDSFQPGWGQTYITKSGQNKRLTLTIIDVVSPALSFYELGLWYPTTTRANFVLIERPNHLLSGFMVCIEFFYEEIRYFGRCCLVIRMLWR